MLYTRIGFECIWNPEHSYWGVAINHQTSAIAPGFICAPLYKSVAELK